jgi:four helix bundle protein
MGANSLRGVGVLPYERLEVYWLADEYVAFIDHILPRIRRKTPNDADQLDRAASSIPNNIAEGSADRSRADRIRFFTYSRRSSSECHNIILRAGRSRCVSEAEVRISHSYADRLSAMLYKLIRVQ